MKGTIPAINRALREGRQAADLTQSELAEKAGCSQSAISMFEQGKRDVLAQEKVEEIARILGVDLKSLPADGETPATPGLTLKYCPVGDCPTQEPYQVLDRLCYRPLMILAPASDKTHCSECGELLEHRCPNAQCRAPVRAGSFCRACGAPYVTAASAATEVTEEWMQKRAERARALRAEQGEGAEGGWEPRVPAPGPSVGRKGRR